MSELSPISFRSRAFPKKQLEAAQWERLGKKMAVSLFSFAKQHVPAYRRFLEDQGAVPIVRNAADLKKVPLITKDTYLRKYPYKDLFPPLGLHSASTIAATSGSTGEPFFFPRSPEQDRFYERSLEVLLSKQWGANERTTLVLIGFGLGIWIGGIFTYKNLSALKEKGFPLTLVPIGPHKEFYLKSFKKFAAHYDQVIISGYPPFIKDVLDAGHDHGIDWKKHRIRILTAAEGYSERFRDHLANLCNCDPVKDMINIYGTVEQGTIAHETAIANMIRRLAWERKDVFESLFPGAQNIPTLAQYYPDHVYFEAVDGTIVATGYGSSIPLVRYAFNDLGGVIGFEEMKGRLSKLGIDIEHEIRKYGISGTIVPLPFVYVYGRTDFVLIFRGANIYPEELRASLDSPVLSKWITGKLAATKTESATFDQGLEIHVELNPHVEASEEVREKVLQTLLHDLRTHNSEFNNNYLNDARASTPVIVLHRHNDPDYFGGAGKQKWVIK